MNKVIIALGSNLNPQENILQVRQSLAQKFHILKESSFQKTSPIDHPLKNEFINGCIYLETDLDVISLRRELKQIEIEMGRNHSAGDTKPHPIDLDIIIWNLKVVAENDVIKHSFLKEFIQEIVSD